MPQTIDTITPPRRRRSRPWMAWALGLFTIAAAVDSVFGEAGYLARLRARVRYEQQLAQLTAIRHDNAILGQRRQRLGREASAIEEAARRDLGLIRRGEILVLIRDRTSSAGGATTGYRSVAQ